MPDAPALALAGGGGRRGVARRARAGPAAGRRRDRPVLHAADLDRARRRRAGAARAARPARCRRRSRSASRSASRSPASSTSARAADEAFDAQPDPAHRRGGLASSSRALAAAAARLPSLSDGSDSRRAAARVARPPAAEPARPGARGRGLGAAPELRRDRPLAAQPRDGAAARRAARRAAARAQPPAAGRRATRPRTARTRSTPRRSPVPPPSPGTAAHEPYPAVAVDRQWNLLEATRARPVHRPGPPDLLEPPANVLRASLHPAGLAPHIVNLGEWRAHLLGRLRRQAARTADGELTTLLDELARVPLRDQPEPEVELPGPGDVVVPLRVRHEGGELAFLGAVARVRDAAGHQPSPSWRSSRSSPPTRRPPRCCPGGARGRRAGRPSSGGTGASHASISASGRGIEPVPAALRVDPHLDQPRLAQHAQVLGDGRAG